jgi:hypothetical protein
MASEGVLVQGKSEKLYPWKILSVFADRLCAYRITSI